MVFESNNNGPGSIHTSSAFAASTAVMGDASSPPPTDAYDTRLHMDRIPLAALRQRTRDLLAAHLNRRKVLPSENSYWRDWRGLFDMSHVARSHYAAVEADASPTEALLRRWQLDCPQFATFGRLEQCLWDIDRLDCLDDCRENFDCDAKEYMRQQHKSAAIVSCPPDASNTVSADTGTLTSSAALPPQPPQPPSDSSIAGDDGVLTLSDPAHRQRGEPLQQYDALIIYAEDDADDAAFVRRMIDEMTQRRDLTVCHADDMLAGSRFEHSVRRDLLVERCNRLIVVLSPAFVLSEENKYISNLAQSLGIAKNMRKLIPVVHKECKIPPLFQHIIMLNYCRPHHLYDFWSKLYQSVVRTPAEAVRAPATATVAAVAVRAPVVSDENIPIITVSTAPPEPQKPKHSHTNRLPTLKIADSSVHSADVEADSGSDDAASLHLRQNNNNDTSTARGAARIYPPAQLHRRNSRSMMCLSVSGHAQLSDEAQTGGDSGSERSTRSMRSRFLARPYKRLISLLTPSSSSGRSANGIQSATMTGSEADVRKAKPAKTKAPKVPKKKQLLLA